MRASATPPATTPSEASDLDDVDKHILVQLARDGRATYESLAKNVGLRRPSVFQRVQKLERAGVIRGYKADLHPDLVDAGLLAYVFLKVQCGPGSDCYTMCDSISERLRKFPEVLEAHTLAGSNDMMLKVRASSIRALERLVMKEISGMSGVSRVETQIALRTQFERALTIPTKR